MLKGLADRPVLLALVLALAVLAAYSTMLNSEFKTMDDDYCIVQNDDLRSFRHLPKIFSQSFFGIGAYYRPLVTCTYLVEFQLFGLNAFYYYLDNLVVHVLCAFLVFLVLRELFNDRTRAGAAALLFAIHPVQWEAVANISGRSILLCALFGLAAFYAFLRGGKGRHRPAWLLVSLACFALAMLSKEAGAVVPLLIAAYLFFFRRGKGRPLAASLLVLIPYALVIGLYLYLRVRLGITRTFPWPDLSLWALGTLSFLRSVGTHLRVLIFPVGLRFDRASRLFMSFADPELLLTAAAWLAAGLGIWRWRRRIPREAGFLMAWFAIELLPVSQLVTTIGVQPGFISAADHFLYLPSVAFLALLVMAAERAAPKLARRGLLSRPALGWLAAGFTAFLFLLTLGHNYTAGSEFAMMERTLEGDPGNIRVRYNLAHAYAKRRRFDQAEKHFRVITEQLPTMTKAWAGLGKALCDQGKYWEGIRIWEGIRDGGDLMPLVQDNLAQTYRYLQKVFKAQVREDPGSAALHHTLGVVYAKTGDLDGALACFQRAVALDPGFTDAWFNLAAVWEAKGDVLQARGCYARFLAAPAPDGTLAAIAREKLGAPGAGGREGPGR